MKKLKDLTAVILAKNEEKDLPRVLKSLSFAGEILVIDDGSKDKTVEIAKKVGARILERKLDDFSTQRNFALSKVKTGWVLMIDADEEVSKALAEEIRKVIKKKDFVGWQIPRKNLIFGRWVKHSGWYPDWQLHLFRTKKGKYVRKVHEQVKLDGKVGFLKNPLLHYNYESISHFLSKLQFDLYTSLETDRLVTSGYRFSFPDLVRKPTDEFLRRFFAEKGYQDGVLGLVLALFQAFKEFVVYAKVWEKTSKGEKIVDPEKLLSQFRSEVRKKKKDLYFWLLSTRIKREKNFFKRLCLKLKRKVLH